MAAKYACSTCGLDLPDDAPAGVCPSCLLRLGIQDKLPLSVSAAAFLPPQPEELAERLPHLAILELIGQGGMGAVYKARHRTLDRMVALKILPPETGCDPSFAERFSREARALAKLCHPNIVQIFDFGQTNGLCYVVMEFVDGASLRQLTHTDRLQAQEILKIIPQICDALEYAHQEGVIHRDIKPDNILVDKKGRVKIADFGLAKLLGQMPLEFTLTATDQVMGTPHYMAPEQIEDPQRVDFRTDIYALGVVLYEMLTGELPLGRFAPPSLKAGVDARLDDIVLRALEQEPARRYQHASDMKTDLDAIFGPDARPKFRAAGTTVTLLRKSGSWWSEQQHLRHLCRTALKVLLFATYVVFVLLVFKVDGEQGYLLPDGRAEMFRYVPQNPKHPLTHYVHRIGGYPGWLVMRNDTPDGFRVHLNLASDSLGFALAFAALGLVAYYLYWRLKRWEIGSIAAGQPNEAGEHPNRFRISAIHVVFWLLVAAVAIGSGLSPDWHLAAIKLSNGDLHFFKISW